MDTPMTAPDDRRTNAPLARRSKLGGTIESGAKSGPIIIRKDQWADAARDALEAGDITALADLLKRFDAAAKLNSTPQKIGRTKKRTPKGMPATTAEERKANAEAWQEKRKADAEAKRSNQAICEGRLSLIRNAVRSLNWDTLDLPGALEAVMVLNLHNARKSEQREAIRSAMKGYTLHNLDAGRIMFLRAMRKAAGEWVIEYAETLDAKGQEWKRPGAA